jgi:hypothetical protein
VRLSLFFLIVESKVYTVFSGAFSLCSQDGYSINDWRWSPSNRTNGRIEAQRQVSILARYVPGYNALRRNLGYTEKELTQLQCARRNYSVYIYVCMLQKSVHSFSSYFHVTDRQTDRQADWLTDWQGDFIRRSAAMGTRLKWLFVYKEILRKRKPEPLSLFCTSFVWNFFYMVNIFRNSREASEVCKIVNNVFEKYVCSMKYVLTLLIL